MEVKRHLFNCILLLYATCAATPAWSQIYRCVDSNGSVTLSNITRGAGCEAMQISTITTTPVAPPASLTPPSIPPQETIDGRPSLPHKENINPQARHNPRYPILEQELGNERKLLDEAWNTLNQQKSIRTDDDQNFAQLKTRLRPFHERIAQHERNIQLLEQEIAALK